MFKKVFAASLVGLAMASAAEAATQTYVLSYNDSGTGTRSDGRFAVYAFTSAADNAGIASFSFSVTNGSISGVANVSPRTNFDADDGVGDQKTSGFTLLRATGTTLNVQTTGSFDTVSGNGVIVYGVGQRTGNLREAPPAGFTASGNAAQAIFGVANSFTSNPVINNTFTGSNGQVPTLLATGSFTGAVGSLVFLPGTGNLFNISLNGSSSLPTFTSQFRDLAPEPASLAVLGLVGAGMMARRRKA